MVRYGNRLLAHEGEQLDTRARSHRTRVQGEVGASPGDTTRMSPPFLREQAVSITNHRFGTPLDLAADLL